MEARFWPAFIFIAIICAGVCGGTIGWGLDILRLMPFIGLGNIILINNLIVVLILCPILLAALYNRVDHWGLLYTDLMEEEEISSGGRLWMVGLAAVIIGMLGTYVIGNAAYSETLSAILGLEGPVRTAEGVLLPTGGPAAAPFAVLMIIGALLI